MVLLSETGCVLNYIYGVVEHESIWLLWVCFCFFDSLYSSLSNCANGILLTCATFLTLQQIYFVSFQCARPLFTICQSILLIEASLCASSLLFPASVAFQSISSHPYCSNSRVHLNGDISSKALLVLCQWMKMCFLVICCAPGFVAK